MVNPIDKPNGYNEGAEFAETPWNAPVGLENNRFDQLRKDASNREKVKDMVKNDLNKGVSSTFGLRAQELENERQGEIAKNYLIRYNQLKNEGTILSEVALQKRAMDLATLDYESGTSYIGGFTGTETPSKIGEGSLMDKGTTAFVQEKQLEGGADVSSDDSVYEVAE